MVINPNLFVNILKNFESPLHKNYEIDNKIILNQIISFLIKHGVAIEKNKIERTFSNKIAIALIAIKNGASIVDVCNVLHWHDFELFTSEIMRLHGYTIFNNYRLKKPSREIDVVGLKSKNALLFDCKHWKKNTNYCFNSVVEKQKQRSFLFKQKTNHNIKNVFPVIITFLPYHCQLIDDVPVVSVDKLNSFLLDFENYCQLMFKY